MTRGFRRWSEPLVFLAFVVALVAFLAPTASAATPIITEFSAGISPGSAPSGITAGPDGNLWFTESGTSSVARITPSGVVTEFNAGGRGAEGITAGPDGNLWFTESGNSIGRITPSGVVTEFSTGISPDYGFEGPHNITTGLDGNLWFTEPVGRIGRITPSGVVTEFTTGLLANSSPIDITTGLDGNLWFTDSAGRIGRITHSGVVTEFSAGISPGSSPWYITLGSDGNLWFTETPGNRIGRITHAGVVTEFSAGTNGRPWAITLGFDSNLWFTERSGIGRITPSGIVTEFSAGISPGSNPLDIAPGPDGNLWFAEFEGDRIGRITIPQEPPPTDPCTLAAPPPSCDHLAPVISRLSLTHRVFRVERRGKAAARTRAKRGTTFRYTVSEPATVTFTIQRKNKGRRVAGKCRPTTRSNRKRRRCIRYRGVGRFSQAAVAGANKKRFTGRLGVRKLRPGSYRASLRARDRAGNASRTRRTAFKVVVR